MLYVKLPAHGDHPVLPDDFFFFPTTHWVLAFEYLLYIGFSLDLLGKKSVFLILNGIILFI